MHIYTNEVVDWVIAESEDDANQVLCEQHGYTLEQLADEGMLITAQWPDDKPLTLTEEDAYPAKLTLLPAEWAAREGRCFLGSTQY